MEDSKTTTQLEENEKSCRVNQEFEMAVLEAETADFKSIDNYLNKRKFHDETYLVSKAVGDTWDGLREELEDYYKRTARNLSEGLSDGLPGRPDYGQNSLTGAGIGGSSVIPLTGEMFTLNEYTAVLGFLSGAVVGASAGYLLSKSQHEEIIDSKENQNDYELFQNPESVTDVIQDSSIVKVDTFEFTPQIQNEYVQPKDASGAYQDAIRELKHQENYWQDETPIKFSPSETEKLVEFYGEESKKLNAIDEEEAEEIMKAHGEERLEEPREDTNITCLMRNHEAEPSNIDHAYQIEIYQGEEKVIQIRGLHSGLMPSGEDINYETERQLKDKIIGLDKTAWSKWRED